MLEDAFADWNAVHERAIGTPEIAERKAPGRRLDRAVTTGDQVVRNAELAAAVATDGHAGGTKCYSFAAKWAREDDKFAAHTKSLKSKQEDCRAVSSSARNI